MEKPFAKNCPINEVTADGRATGRCWHYLTNKVCPRHGDVSKELKIYKETGKLTREDRRY